MSITGWISWHFMACVGNLEPRERITQILKFQLEQRHQTRFITDRWGRGVFWQWICWLPRANREVKPVFHAVNFGCSKLFISAVIGEQATGELAARNITRAAQLRPAMRACVPDYWAGSQLYYAVPERDVRACTGLGLVKAITGVFGEVTPVMNCCI